MISTMKNIYNIYKKKVFLTHEDILFRNIQRKIISIHLVALCRNCVSICTRIERGSDAFIYIYIIYYILHMSPAKSPDSPLRVLEVIEVSKHSSVEVPADRIAISVLPGRHFRDGRITSSKISKIKF